MTRQYKTDINVTGASVSGSTVATQPWVSSTYSPLVSPTFTGTPLAPTASSGTATTQLATTQFVQSAVATQAALTASTGYTAYLYNTTSTALPQNTIVPATYNGTTVANGITYNGSSVTFVYPGYYNVDYNIQINGGVNGSIVNAWYRKNGVDIPNTNYEITLSNQNPASLIQGVYSGSFDSGDILEVMVLATGTSGMYMWAQGAVVGPPDQPSTPAVVLNISQVTYIQQGSSISGGSATNVTLVGNTINSGSITGGIIALGSGVYTSSATPFYANNSGSVSIGNKLAWTGSALFIGDQVNGTTGFQAPLNPSSSTVAIYAGASAISSASIAPFRVNYGGTLFSASTIINSSSSTSTPLTVQAASSQTADLTQWKDSNGNVRTKVDALGNISASGATPLISVINSNSNQRLALTSPGGGPVIEYGDATTPQLFGYSGARGNALTFQGTARPVRFQNTSTTGVVAQFTAANNQSADFTQWAYGVDSGSLVLAGVTSSGMFYTGASAIPNTQLTVIPAASNVAGMVIKQNPAGQLANIFAIQDFNGNTIASFNSVGQLGTAGRFSVGNGGIVSSTDTALIANTASGSVGLRITSPNGMTKDNFRVETFGGTSVFGVASAGYTYAGNGTYLTPNGRSQLVLSNSNSNGTVIEIQNSNNNPSAYSAIFLGIPTSGTFAQIRQSPTADLNWPNYLTFYTFGSAVTALAGNQWNFLGAGATQTSLIARPFSLSSGSALILPVISASSNGTGTASIIVTNTSLIQATGAPITTTGIISTSNPSGAAASAFNQNRAIATFLSSSVITIPITLTDTYTSGGTVILNQSGDLQQWQGWNSNGVGLTTLAGVNWNGQFYTGTTSAPTNVQMYIQQPNTSTTGLLIKGAVGTSTLFDIQNSAGTSQFSVGSTGIVQTAFLKVNNNITNPNSTAPTISFGGNNGTAITLNTTASANIGFIIQGVTSQTGDLIQYQNSSGSILARVSANGAARYASVSTATIDLATLAASTLDTVEAATGEYVMFGTGTTNTAQTNNEGRMQFVPAIWSSSLAITAIAVYTTASGGPSSSVRLGAYTNDRGMPANLIADFGTIATSASGVNEKVLASASTILTTGNKFYWAFCLQGNDATKPTVRTAQNTPALWQTLMPNGGGFDAVYGGQYTSASFASATFPSTIARTAITVSGGQSNVVPVVRARIA